MTCSLMFLEMVTSIRMVTHLVLVMEPNSQLIQPD
jgi:hypothetical protein